MKIKTEREQNSHLPMKQRAVSKAVRRQVFGVAAIVGIGGCGFAHAELEEIVVTASKREQSLQDVAVAVIALDSKTLDDVGIGDFSDYVRYQPNLTASGRGPGNASFYIRGMATDQITANAAEVAGTAPNVALYLDEQPISSISRNLDVYVTDMERIEVLAGPQGTLFGASSQAGTVRLITKKPQHEDATAGVKVSVADTKSGEMSTSAEGYINIPVIEDKLAVRFVGYSVNKGGFIDNVSGSFNGLAVNTNSRLDLSGLTLTPATNTELVKKDFNDTSYNGFRVAADYRVNDEWSVLLQHMRQRMDSDGVFAQDPSVGDLQVSHYFPNFLEDEFSQTAITVKGSIGSLDITYAGAFLDRDVEQSRDNQAYAEGAAFLPFYLCNATTCFDPTYGVRFTVENERTSHELRIATDAEQRLRFIGGVYFDDSDLLADVRFTAPGQLDNGPWPQQTPLPNTTTFNPNPRDPGVNFLNDVTRIEEQEAIFGELTYDLIPDTLSATLGLRYYEQTVGLAGSTNFFARGDGVNDTDIGINIDEALADRSPATEDDTIMKLNLSWTPNEDSLFYLTYSEGFRPGGFNRRGGPAPNNPAVILPFGYGTDTVENYEFGWKTHLLDGRLRWNGSMYRVDWSDVQLSITDFALAATSFTTNLGEAEITGIDSDIAFAANDNLTLYAAFAYNDTELTSRRNDVFQADNLVPVGSPLAFAPEFQYNLRGRYVWDWSSQYQAHAQLAIQHADDSVNSLVASQAVTIPSWTTADATFGLSNDEYSIELFANNLTDERVIRSIDQEGISPEQFVTRPRTIGVRFNYNF